MARRLDWLSALGAAFWGVAGAALRPSLRANSEFAGCAGCGVWRGGGAGGQARPGRPASRPGQPASQTATRGLGQLSLTAQLDNPARQPSLDSQRAKPAGQASRPKIRRSVPHLGHWRPPNCPALIWIRGEGAVAPKWLSRKNCFEDARKGRSLIACKVSNLGERKLSAHPFYFAHVPEATPSLVHTRSPPSYPTQRRISPHNIISGVIIERAKGIPFFQKRFLRTTFIRASFAARG